MGKADLIVDVLRFEFVTQLLLDHNYLPLILKLFAHQDIQQLVDCKTDRIENRYALLESVTAAQHNC